MCVFLNLCAFLLLASDSDKNLILYQYQPESKSCLFVMYVGNSTQWNLKTTITLYRNFIRSVATFRDEEYLYHVICTEVDSYGREVWFV